MSQAAFSADLIVIIAIAIFVIYKYRQVLGHKTGHDVENQSNQPPKQEQRVVSLKQFQEEVEHGAITIEQEEEPEDKAFEALADAKPRDVIEKIKEQENFSLDDFTIGAKAAFDMVMEAFEKADRTALKQLLSDDLYREFDQELKQFAKQKQKPQTTLVSILSANLVDAALDSKQQISLTIRFLSEQIHLVKDEKGEIVEGDASRIEQVEDEWVFERPLRSRNPNWMITDM